MRFDGYQLWDVRRLKMPSDIARRMKQPHVIALAESTDDLGGEPMHAPTVNADVHPAALVAGRDRMAATLLRKRKRVWVHVGKDWTAADLLKAEIHENLHRRHDDKAELTRRLVDKAEEVVSGQTSDNDEAPAAGRPKTQRTKARELVAKEAGKTVEAVRKADERAQARDEGAAGNRVGGPAASPPPPIETFGHDMPGVVAVGIGTITAVFDKADRLLQQAQAALSALDMTSFSPGVAARLKAAIHDDAAMVRAERPYALCPYCIKGLAPDQLQGDGGPKCRVCQEQRYVTRSQFEAAPAEKRGTADVDRHIARAASAVAPSRKRKEPTVVVNGVEMTAAQVEALAAESP